MFAKCDEKKAMWFKSYEHFHYLVTDGRTHILIIVQTKGSCNFRCLNVMNKTKIDFFQKLSNHVKK